MSSNLDWLEDVSVPVVICGKSRACTRLRDAGVIVYQEGMEANDAQFVVDGRRVTLLACGVHDTAKVLANASKTILKLSTRGAIVRYARIVAESPDEHIATRGIDETRSIIDAAELAGSSETYISDKLRAVSALAGADRSCAALNLLGHRILLALIHVEGDIARQKVKALLKPFTALGRNGKIVDDAVDAYARELAQQQQTAKQEQKQASEYDFDPRFPFVIVDGQYCRMVPEDDDEVEGGVRWEPKPFTNFTCTIKRCEIVDDGTGAEPEGAFEINGTLDTGHLLPMVRVLTREYDDMRWVTPAWPRRAFLAARDGARSELAVAIRLLSDEAITESVNARTGWKETDQGWVYLTGNGAIGGDSSIKVRLTNPAEFGLFELPDVDPNTLVQDILISLSFLRLRGMAITGILGAAAYTSVLMNLIGINFYVWLWGKTQGGKSNLLAVVMKHFGAGFQFDRLPASFSGTELSIRALLSRAYDSVLAVDNFLAKRRNSDQVIGLLHAIGDRKGRTRMKRDGTAQEGRDTPHSLMIASGEEAPPDDQGAHGRGIIIHVQHIDRAAFAKEKDFANKNGPALNRAMSGFIRWLHPKMNDASWRESRIAMVEKYRTTITLPNEATARDDGKLAMLLTGLHTWNEFAVEADAITEAEGLQLETELIAAYADHAPKQADLIDGASNADRFVSGIEAMMASRRVCLIPKGNALADFEESGGRIAIGWYDADVFYLDPALALQAACDFNGRDWVFGSKRGLYQLLADAGYIEVDAEDGKSVRNVKVVGPATKRVLCFKRARLEAVCVEVHSKTETKVKNQNTPWAPD